MDLLSVSNSSRQVLFPVCKEQAKLERMRTLEEKAKMKVELAQRRLQLKEESVRAREQAKADKALRKQQIQSAKAQKRYRFLILDKSVVISSIKSR